MTFTIELNEQDIKEAVEHWLKETRGMKVTGSLSFYQLESMPPQLGARAQAEPIVAAQASAR